MSESKGGGGPFWLCLPSLPPSPRRRPPPPSPPSPLLTYDANPPPPSWLDAAPPPPPSVSHASLTLPCGAAYTGDALDGTVPHGQGTLTRANGDTYTGGWREGAQAGKGVAAFADGRAYDGEWEGGAPHG